MKKLICLLSPVIFTLFITVSCGTTSKTSLATRLSSHPWELYTLNGEGIDVNEFRNSVPFLTFDISGKLTGSAGCNKFAGTFDLKKDAIKLVPGVMTRMACPGNGETLFLATMAQVTKIKMNGNKVAFFDDSKELMTFVPKK
jgi:heat shock protein HslJ